MRKSLFVDWKHSLVVNLTLRIYETSTAGQNPVFTYVSAIHIYLCSGLNEIRHHRLMFEYLSPAGGTNWEEFGGGAGFEISKDLGHSQSLSLPCGVSRCELSDTAPAVHCWPAATLPAIMVINPIPLKL